MNWLEVSKRNLLPLSEEQKNFNVALREWEYRGYCIDTGAPPDEHCQLCETSGLRYHFEIINKINDNTLLIGSECVLKFELDIIDQYGNILIGEAAAKKIGKDRNRLIAEGKKIDVINTLILLKKNDLDGNFDMDKMIKYYQSRGAFTPKQMSSILWRSEKCKIQLNPTSFKVIITRKREQEQLLYMEEWKVKKILPVLSASQKKWVESKRNISMK